jgi:cobalt-zinc-cadmium efflux system outer membrane protein
VRALSATLLIVSACAERYAAADVRSVAGTAHVELPALSNDVGPEEDDAAVAQLLEAPLTAESAEKIALLNNRRIRAALRRLPRGALVQAGLLPNPSFNAIVRFSQEPALGPQWDLDLGYDISRLLLRGPAVAAAEKDFDAAKLEAAQAVLDLTFTTRATLFAVQAATRRVELARQGAQAASASFQTAKVLYDAGNLPARELLLYQADDEEARLKLGEQQDALSELEADATALMGLHGRAWTAAPLPGVPQRPVAPLDTAETKAVEASLELQQQRAQLEATAHRIGYTKLEGVLPDLSVAVHAERFGPYWELGPALQGRLPLFDRKQGTTMTLEAELDALKESYVATAVEVRAAVRATQVRMLSALGRAQQQRDVLVPLRKRVLEETLKTYNAMHVSVFELIEARKAQVATDVAYADASLEYFRARAALDTLLAGRLVKLK